MIIKLSDVKKAGMCSKGARKFFKDHQLIEWSDFIENGVESELLVATGDAMALQVVEAAKNGR